MDTRKRILVVEDEPDILALFVRLLEEEGYEVLSTSRPSEAVRMLVDLRLRIDVLITDHMMPGMTGTALGQIAKRMRPRIRVMGVSGVALLIRAPDSPYDSLLQKPVKGHDLLKKVRWLAED
ncbi:MAG: response regulator [Elusimicrobia bacterium]|nr:response regulator [Elusimicrobiota bacterium]